MPCHVYDRPKMTKATYQALKRHIMHERERKKQAEQEQDEALERIRKEREMRKKKEEEDSLTLEQTIQQIQELEKQVENLKHEKHQLFTQLKSVLHHEDSRKKVQTKENSSDIFPLTQQFHPNYPPVLMPAHLQNKRYMAVNVPSSGKRTRSPSPPPALTAAAYYAPPSKYSAAQYPPSAIRQPEPYANIKQIGGHLAPVQSTHVSATQPGLAYHQAMGGQNSQPSIINLPHAAAMSPHYLKSQAAAAQFVPPPPHSSYPSASQSAFSSYPAHYVQQQPPQQQQRQPTSMEYQLHRMAQSQAYFSPMAVALQQHQQLEQQQQHISQKASSRQIPGLPPAGASIMALPPQQSAPLRGSIVTGYPVRPPPAGSAIFQNMPGSSQSASNMAAKHPYGGQSMPKYAK